MTRWLLGLLLVLVGVLVIWPLVLWAKLED